MRDYLPRALSRSVPLAAATVAAVALAGCGAVRPAAQTTAFPATALRSATVRLSAARAHLARASAARAFVTPRPAARRIAAPYLSSVFFLSPVRGYGLFLRQAGSRCAYLVGRTSDGGARFAKPVTAAQGRSVWMARTGCPNAGQLPARPCRLRVLESGNGGRTWRALPGQPPGATVTGAGIGIPLSASGMS